MKQIRYALIRKTDISNGEGLGVSLFVQGCHTHCRGCFNPETWDFDGGKEWTPETEELFLSLIDKPHIKRVSFLGGEPLAEENVGTILHIINKVRSRYPDKKIWLYTGYTWESAMNNDLQKSVLKNVDVVVDGSFDIGLKNPSLSFRGSSNQRLLRLLNGEILSIE